MGRRRRGAEVVAESRQLESDDPIRLLGRRLDAARRRKGWTYRAFEEHTGVSKSTLQYLVRSRKSPPDYYELRGLVDRLGEQWDGEWERLWRRAIEAVPAQLTPGEQARTPAQLPTDVQAFTGRGAELAQLDELVVTHGAATMVISMVCGTAGVGKTTLAIHWAHRVREAFPDGQLYVDLRGYDAEQPLAAGTALTGFLHALGMDAKDIPFDVDERAAAYRTLLDGRRVLVVLDNAASVDQVRLLLPGSPTCMVLVTSRDSLAGLVARYGAQRLELDRLPLADAVTLLGTLVGDRIHADPRSAGKLAEQCARLPLALRVAAELATSRPATQLDGLVAELEDRRRRLDLLDAGGDQRTDVRAVFSWSYDHLHADAARVFGLLGTLPGKDVEPRAVAAVARTSADQACRLLVTLARAHLVEPAGSGRYRMHDLLRAYAADQTTAEATGQAMSDLLDHYVTMTSAATNSLHPAQQHTVGTAAPSTEPHTEPATKPSLEPPTGPFADGTAALAWLQAEQPNLITACVHAATHGRPAHAVRLAAALSRYLAGGHFTDAVTVHSHAVDAARRRGDLAAEAAALNNLGTTYQWQSRYPAAAEHLSRALALYREVGDHEGAAAVVNSLAGVAFRLGLYEQAVDHLRQALAVCRRDGYRYGEARALGNLGNVTKRQGQYQQAVTHLEQALTLFRELGRRDGEAIMLDHLGHAYGRMGSYQRALDHHESALALYRQIGDRYGEADTLDNLGQVYRRMGHYERATEYRRRALTLYREIGIPSGEAEALNGIGETLQACSQPADALTSHTAALELAAAIGDRYEQARAHHGVADSHRAAGDLAAARKHWAKALALYAELAVPEADDVRAKLGGSERNGHARHKP